MERVEIKIGDVDLFGDAWYEAVRALAREKIAETLRVPIEKVVDESNLCNDDEAFHFRVGDKVFHVCYSDPREVFVVEEIKCPKCGEWVPANVLDEHLEIEHEVE